MREESWPWGRWDQPSRDREAEEGAENLLPGTETRPRAPGSPVPHGPERIHTKAENHSYTRGSVWCPS